MDILEFKGGYRWLSNFYPALVTFDGQQFPSVENAYQAAKTVKSSRDKFLTCSPGESKRLGRKVSLGPKYDQVKVEIMKQLLEQKFAPGTELAKKLLATGDGMLVEGNYWHDTFWGVCNGIGENTLGKLLMNQRKQLFLALS